MFLSPSCQRHEATGTPETKTADSMHGSLVGGDAQLHCPGGPVEGRVHAGVRLVVGGSHPLRDDHWVATLLCRQPSHDSGQGEIEVQISFRQLKNCSQKLIVRCALNTGRRILSS